MNLDDVQAVIESAEARGIDPLVRFIRQRLPEATEEEVRESAEVAMEVIESVPVLLARASQAAEERELERVVQPLLDHVADYFLRPVDLIPEMTQGLAGLLDDTYLVLRVLQNLDRGPEPLLDWDLSEPLAFLRRLVGERISQRLDEISMEAIADVAHHVDRLWDAMAAEA